MTISMAMGSLPWCGRRGASYTPDGIGPAVLLYPLCLFGDRGRQEVKNYALRIFLRVDGPPFQNPTFILDHKLLWNVAGYL